MASFRELFSFDSYKILTIKDQDEKRTPQQYQDAFNTELITAFTPFFQELITEGRVKPIDPQGRSINFVHEWNSIVNGTDPEWRNIHIRSVAFDILHGPLSSSTFRNSDSADPVQAGYDSFIKQLDTGTLEDFFGDRHQCHKSGERVSLEITNWVPAFFLWKDGERVPAEPLPVTDPINELTITIESGELLIADWFRIPAFTESTDYHYKYDINSEAGVIEATKYYARDHGFVSVFVGNSSPTVWQRGETLVCGREKYDSDTDEEADVSEGNLGGICTDLWWATIIDRAQLERIVGKTHDAAEVKSLVEKAIDDGISVSVKVEPGTYTLKFAAHPDLFTENYKAPEGLDITGIDPFFTLTRIG